MIALTRFKSLESNQSFKAMPFFDILLTSVMSDNLRPHNSDNNDDTISKLWQFTSLHRVYQQVNFMMIREVEHAELKVRHFR